MQYPIIDNLIYAYQRNGWTGLELTYGKNLIDYDEYFSRYKQPDDSYIEQMQTFYLTHIHIPSSLNGEILTASVYVKKVGETAPSGIRIHYNGDISIDGNILSLTEEYQRTVVTFTAEENSYINFTYSSGGGFSIQVIDFMLEIGNQATQYEPYAPPTTDIANRLKLPLPHYFPHPVIDAIISAADGQHTEEEKEVLRHYLTPLGIGGI